MRIAVNVADITRHPLAGMILGPVTPSREIVRMDKARWDEAGLVLECDEERARAIVELFRDGDEREGRYATRAYKQGPRGGWSKLEKDPEEKVEGTEPEPEPEPETPRLAIYYGSTRVK